MLDENLIAKVSEILHTDYSRAVKDVEKCNSMLEELLNEIDRLNDEIKNIIQEREDNYVRINYEDMI